MSRKGRVALVVVVAVLLLVSGTVCAYWIRHSMGPVRSYERGQPSMPAHVLIASQESAFKSQLVTDLVQHLEQRPAFVKVIDVTALGDIDAADWPVIVLVHTWEFGNPPRAVASFMARAPDSGAILAVTTSGGGREKLPGVDAISSASVVDDLPAILAELKAKIDVRLAALSAPAAPGARP